MNPFSFFRNLLAPIDSPEPKVDAYVLAPDPLGDSPIQDPTGQPVMDLAQQYVDSANRRLAKLRKAEYVNSAGVGKCFSSKTPAASVLSAWLSRTREELLLANRSVQPFTMHTPLYRLAARVLPKELNTHGSFPALPTINARILQLKRLTRGKARASLKPYRARLLDAELATLRAKARYIQLCCEWINSELPLGIYMDKKFKFAWWTEHQALRIIGAIAQIRFAPES